ncbi:MAG: tetratricopeptide repeat protein [Candidatus Omnitrophica bacterium]|nr:tetratricopeptide repeat protein [Candidatus Omnitrophota bacterium]
MMRSFMWFRMLNFAIFFSLTPILLLTAGCTATTGGSIRANYTKVSQIQEADKFFEKGQYQTALLKYSSYVYAPFPNKKFEDYAVYKMGLCQFLLNQYHDAQKTINLLQSKYPGFEYMQQANDLKMRTEEKINSNNKLLAQKWSDLQKDISKTEQLAAQNPQNPDYTFQLGDLYWDAGRFDDALKQYEAAAKLDKSFLEKKTLRSRIRITTDGEFRLRDPLYENIQKSSPIKVVDMRRDRIEREDWLGTYESIRLSGYVKNDGLYDVTNVNIEVAIYDFFDTIQETKIVSIGDLRAGAQRPFSVLFNQYRGLGIDITKYTTEVFYDEPAAAKR